MSQIQKATSLGSMIEEDVDQKVKDYFEKHTFDIPLNLKTNKDMSQEKKEFVHHSKVD